MYTTRGTDQVSTSLPVLPSGLFSGLVIYENAGQDEELVVYIISRSFDGDGTVVARTVGGRRQQFGPAVIPGHAAGPPPATTPEMALARPDSYCTT